jgi:cytochrome c-type biogenesis protein CcmF
VPSWAIWAGDIGRGLILLGIFAFIGAIFKSVQRREKSASILFVVGSVTLLGAFGCLAWLFVKNQFEYAYVFEHGDALTDLKYKIAGVWSGQQGSFLLWAVTSAVFGMLALRFTGIYKRWYTATYALFLGSLCGILSYETPFKLRDDLLVGGHMIVPPSGAGLNASLQNYWVVIHPPTIFTGFGSLTVLFCFAVSAMLTGNLIDWARLVRPWALLSVGILGLGICMGGLWAYETLGWGGFWAWDPVENASFVPWLLTVAFVHGLIVMVTKGKWIASTLLLGGLPFVSFVYGTFLTRSGFLANASVHSFAEMNRSALWILLGILIVSVVGFLGLWLARSQWRKTGVESSQEINRVTFYKVGVTLLSLMSLAVAIGMSVPFFMAISGKASKVVSEGLYHMVVVWFFVPIILLVAIGPFVSWRSLGSGAFWSRILNVFFVTIGLTGAALFVYKLRGVGIDLDPTSTVAMPFGKTMHLMTWMGILTFLCIFAMVSNLWRVGELSKRANVFSWGGFVAHLGVAVLMAGLLLSRGFERKEQVLAVRDEPVNALGWTLIPRAPVTPGQPEADMEDRNTKMPVDVSNQDGVHFTAMPGLYVIPGDKLQTQRWPYIQRSLSHDMYLALGDPITTVWDEPKVMQPGGVESESTFFSLKYDGYKMQGKPGQMGTKFVAKLHLNSGGVVYNLEPSLTMTPNGLRNSLADAGPQFYVSIESINPADGSATVKMWLKNPVYPMELFYKPLTSLVWLGAGILFLGALMAAFYRRPRSSNGEFDADPASAVEEIESKEDALVTAP